MLCAAPLGAQYYTSIGGKDQITAIKPRSTGRSAAESLYARTMNRIFLAFMALLAGLAAQVAPAAARLSEDQQIGVAADVQAPGHQVAVQIAAPAFLPQGERLLINRAPPAAYRYSAPALNAVLIGIDRARE